MFVQICLFVLTQILFFFKDQQNKGLLIQLKMVSPLGISQNQVPQNSQTGLKPCFSHYSRTKPKIVIRIAVLGYFPL
jgi:hypothetical protein